MGQEIWYDCCCYTDLTHKEHYLNESRKICLCLLDLIDRQQKILNGLLCLFCQPLTQLEWSSREHGARLSIGLPLDVKQSIRAIRKVTLAWELFFDGKEKEQ